MDVIVKGQPSIEIGFETKVIQVGGLGDIDSSLSTESENPVMNKVITAELGKKVDKELGKGLSTNDFTTSEKEKLAGLENYDDAELRREVESLATEVESNNELIEDLQNTKIDKEADDYYPQLAVGLADNLSGVDVVDSEVNFRRSGGGAISDGVARIEAIKGNSVVWNQLRKDGVFKAEEKWGVSLSLDGQCVVLNGTATSNIVYRVATKSSILKGHQYLIQGGKSGEANYNFFDANLIDTFGQNNTIFIAKGSGEPGSQRIYCENGITFNNYRIEPRLIDLTQMFGAGNEPTTIEDFYARIPMGVDLNAYNEGEVIHMDVQSIESVGVNQWDEEWENGTFNTTTGANISNSQIRSKNLIKVLPDTEYHVTIPSFLGNDGMWVLFYDQQGELIEGYKGGDGAISNNAYLVRANSGFLCTAKNAWYIKFYMPSGYGTTYNHDICINLSDTSINGKYFPYIKRVEDLSIIRKYFPQGMKSAGTAHDEIRYNKATQKWEMVQRIGEVDMGTLSWAKSGIYTNGYYALPLSGAKPLQYPLCRLYSAVNVSSQQDKSIYVGNNGGQAQLFVIDSAYTDVVSFKAAMSGVILYYELAEPIVTELDAEDQFKDLDYQVWNAGTEKAIAEGKSAPLAADITYGFNAIGKIKELESLVAQLRAKVGI